MQAARVCLITRDGKPLPCGVTKMMGAKQG
jgi:hypothetical protein